MKKIFTNKILISALSFSLFLAAGCQKEMDELKPAEFPKNPEVFIDDFSSGLNYAAFGNSDVMAFQVDNQVTYSGTKSMRFEVPDYGSPAGAYAGGAFFTSVGRNLKGFTALTFWIKASQAANIDVLGFGNYLGDNMYEVSVSGVAVNTNWKKVVIPIPDPSKLTAERGMFFYSEGPENGKGYTFWIDEVKFENLGTITFQSASILNGETRNIVSFVGLNQTIDGLKATFSLPNGVNQDVKLTPHYFTFSSTSQTVATVNNVGKVSTVGAGAAQIKATLGGKNALGALSINSLGVFSPAPTPTVNPSKVISLFSDAYTNVPVDYYNGYWAPYQTTGSADFVVNNDHVLNYTNFNFVGIQTSAPTVDAKMMSHLHMDIYIPGTLQAGAKFNIQILDFGANGTYGGGDDVMHETSVSAPTLKGQEWVRLDLPFTSMTNLTTRSHIGQIIFIGTNISNFYADNIYFYNDGSIIPPVPTTAAPAPSHSASSVFSIFSDAYNNLSGTDFNPYWGQNTVVSQIPISGNNTLKYANLNYQGTQLGANIDVSTYAYLHIDYYSANSSLLKIFMISPGSNPNPNPVEVAYSLPVPSGIGTNTNGWKSIDIPLSSFAPVNLGNIFQFKIEGNGDIYFDNIYFRK